MRIDVARDLGDSAYDFQRVVWPAISDLVGGGELKLVEATTSRDFATDLDCLAGIDAWQVIRDRNVMRSVASRVQWTDLEHWPREFLTFTIRHERPNAAVTEYEKRCYALMHRDEQWAFPALTIQAYLTKPRRQGMLIAAASIQTSDLYEYAMPRVPKRRKLRNPEDGVLFTSWRWLELQAAGYTVMTLDTRKAA